MDDSDSDLLQGIVEADETYIGGNARNKKKKWTQGKCGRGTNKVPVARRIDRGGKVIAKYMKQLGGGNVSRFLLGHIKSEDTILMTDEFKVYKRMHDYLNRRVVNYRRKEYVNGDIHTNTTEGFFSILTRAYHGTHHSYAVKWLPMNLRKLATSTTTETMIMCSSSFLTGV